ncbi:MAG: hypothetical protein J6A75_13685 [Lachnospiraceae bacterium]|nr:hypothetical protein [Lachnospiraceae bacterium]
MSEITNISDCNGNSICVGDTVVLFGMVGTVCFECGAYGIGFNQIDWELIEGNIYEITGCNNNPSFCYNNNFISFWELLWNFNCEENYCIVVEKISQQN